MNEFKGTEIDELIGFHEINERLKELMLVDPTSHK